MRSKMQKVPTFAMDLLSLPWAAGNRWPRMVLVRGVMIVCHGWVSQV